MTLPKPWLDWKSSPMNKLIATVALVVAVPSGAASAPAPDHRATVVESAEGWTFGKAGAPLLAEYASFGCPHCGQFAAATADRIDTLVKAGKLRFAYRPFLIFPQDRAASVLARCVAPKRRLGFINAMLRGQAQTKARLAAADANEVTRGKLYAAELDGPVAEARALADASGLGELAAAHGLPAAEQDGCLAAAANYRWVTDADMTARLNGITGTPTYVWKGSKVPSGTPEALLSLLPR